MTTTNEEIRKYLEEAIAEHTVRLFLESTPEAPACGFSMRTSACLNALGVQYAAMDILPDPRIREELSAISDWPTIPQLFAGGKLVGGCDIVTEMYQSGELQHALGLDDAGPAQAPEPQAPEPAPLSIENRL